MSVHKSLQLFEQALGSTYSPSHHPVLIYFHRLFVFYGTHPCCQTMSLLALRPARAQPLMDESVGRRKNTGLALAEGAEKTSPHHVVNLIWQNIIPVAELKSVLTPPALSLLHCLSLHLSGIQLNLLAFIYSSYSSSPLQWFAFNLFLNSLSILSSLLHFLLPCVILHLPLQCWYSTFCLPRKRTASQKKGFWSETSL